MDKTPLVAKEAEEKREAPQEAEPEGALLAKLIDAQGDLEALTPEERLRYYKAVCAKLGLDPTTQPFFVLRTRDGQVRLYLNRGGAEALRRIHGVSIQIVRTTMGGNPSAPTYYEVVVEAQTPDGRKEQALAVANLRGKRGNDLENAILTAETKAKRRATLSILALGSLALDETEALSMVGARLGRIDPETGQLAFSYEGAEESQSIIRADQVRAIAEALARLGSQDKEVNRLIASLALGREVASIRQLTEEEGEELLRLLKEALGSESPSLALANLLRERGGNPEAIAQVEAALAPF